MTQFHYKSKAFVNAKNTLFIAVTFRTTFIWIKLIVIHQILQVQGYYNIASHYLNMRFLTIDATVLGTARLSITWF